MINLGHIDRQQRIKFFIHFIVVCMLFFLPDLLTNISHPHKSISKVLPMYVRSASFVAVFYINYYLIIKKTLLSQKRNYLMFVVWNVALSIALLYFNYVLSDYLWGHHSKKHRDLPQYMIMLRNWSWILRDVVMIILTVALSAALRLGQRWRSVEKRHEQMLASQRQEELDNLKSQLNPHFLFNTLNTIYSLIAIDQNEAQNAIHQLSKLLRYVLYTDSTSEPLSKEIDFAKSYIALMEMRLGPEAVKADFSRVKNDVELPPMLFVSLIENAFKHGNTGVKGQPIEITISSDSSGCVICRTRNHFILRSSDQDTKKGGIGLANLRRRLQLIYGANASLSTEVTGDVYTATLKINGAGVKS